MSTKINTFLILVGFFLSLLMISPLVQASEAGYQVVYRHGDAPFKKNGKYQMSQQGDAYSFTAKKGETWTIPLNKVRGAVSSGKSLWLYWFDGQNQTLTANFKMRNNQEQAASEINTAVKEYYKRNIPMTSEQSEQYRARYDAYKEEAIKKAR